MSRALVLLLAMLLDAAFGEPEVIWKRIPHPAVLMGRLIDRLERQFNRGPARRAKGAVALAIPAALLGVIGWLIDAYLPFGWIISLLVAAILIAQRSLAEHVQAVASALDQSLEAGRTAVAKIVGRETKAMTPPDVARAAIESAAENLSDGVVAPIFWFTLFGLPGILVYKFVNTADSMIAHKTERHAEFGYATAKVDTALNFLPARLTALLILLVTWAWPARDAVLADAKKHRSVNAGYPEAAMAHALGVALSGPRVYHGQRTDQPYINESGLRAIGSDEISAAVLINWRVWALLALVAAVLAIF